LKRKLSWILLFALLGGLMGCSKDDSPTGPTPSSQAYLWVHFLTDSVKVTFDTLPKIDADGVEAIPLSEFVDTVLVPMFRDKNGVAYDARELYAYQIVADDGYSASETKGYFDNVWQHLQLGHILTETRRVVFPDDRIDLPGAFDVKDAGHIHIHRKFDVELPDTAIISELRNYATTQVANFDGVLENAVALKDFVPSLVTNPEEYNYNLRTLDNFGPTTNMTWSQFQTGYWLMNTQLTIFTDTTLVGGKYKLKALERILVTP
jgi:hypothetical protein